MKGKHKMSWPAKAMHLVFALALVFGLSATAFAPQTASAVTDLAVDAAPDKGYSPFDVTFTATWATGVGPFSIVYNYGDGTSPVLYNGVGSPHVVGHTYTTQGLYTCTVTITDAAGVVDVATVEIGVDPMLVPNLAMDVKASVQKFVLLNVPGGTSYDEFEADITANGLQAALANVQSTCDEVMEWDIIPNLNLTSVGLPGDNKDITVVGGGGPTFNPGIQDDWIEIRATKPGDCFISVWLDEDLDVDSSDPTDNITDNDLDLEITSEKKWGVIDHTCLDLKPSTTCTPTEDGCEGSCEDDIQATAGEPGYPHMETFEDWISAWFFWGPGEPMPLYIGTAGHAIVHWWLINDDAAGVNEAAIRAIMASLGPDGCGGYAPPPALTPKAQIDAVWAPNKAAFTDFTDVDGTAVTIDGFYNLAVDITATYIRTMTEDDFPFEERGRSTVHTANTGGEEILIVTLSEYPDLTDPTHAWDYHGENPVCIEIGKKQFGQPPPSEQVKTPQLRWAGEKIVLEKDWANHIESGSYIVVYHLEEQSVGEISRTGDNPAAEMSEGDIWVVVSAADPISEVVLETEVQGEADINAKLYKAEPIGPEFSEEIAALGFDLDGNPLVNYGFLVYYMAFEDVTLAEDLLGNADEDITPLAGLQQLGPNDDANVAVQVRGYFTSDELPGTDRPAVDIDGDHVYDLPAGRYVMPDDWWALAHYNFDLRPNWDLMDQAHMDSIDSTAERGAFNTAVRTTDPPNVAEYPTIGPFNTLQRWSNELMWIAEAATVPCSDNPPVFRNTVVPDGVMSWHDAPMPEALVIFDIVAFSVATGLSSLDKGDLVGYGVNAASGRYESPFYAAEIPSSPLIPSNDYDYDSWSTDTPYDFWVDLTKKSIDDDEPAVVNTQDMEIYSDNHGIAGVTIDALGEDGLVTITATAEYPAALKKGKYGPLTSEEITVTWGYEEQNPHFQADATEIAVGGTVTFTNLSALGDPPWLLAQWDFEADGIVDMTFNASLGENPLSVASWVYDTEGVYSVKLTMTDSSTTRYELRPNYIIVGAGVPTVVWSFGWGPDVFPAHFPEDAVVVTLADLTDIPAEILGVYWPDPVSGDWLSFLPGFPAWSDLETLVPGENYSVAVSDAVDWTIPLPIP